MSRSIQKTKRLHWCKVTMGDIYTLGELFKQKIAIFLNEEQLHMGLFIQSWTITVGKKKLVCCLDGEPEKRKKSYLVWRPLATVLDIFSTKLILYTFPKLNENEELNICTAYN